MEIISLTPKNGQQIVCYAAQAIQAGKVIIAPTDTVYGLIADAGNKKAVARLYAIKRRDPSRYLPIFVKNIAMAKKLAPISKKTQKLLEEKWPGKFTFILPRKPAKIFGVDKKTIALRIPHYPFLNSLLETLNIPLCGTSANISGQKATTKIDQALAQFQNSDPKPDLVINAGDLADSFPSQIIDLTQKEPLIIRQ